MLLFIFFSAYLNQGWYILAGSNLNLIGDDFQAFGNFRQTVIQFLIIDQFAQGAFAGFYGRKDAVQRNDRLVNIGCNALPVNSRQAIGQ